MDLILEITSGEQQGEHIPVRDKLTIGRGAADLTIRDSKVSQKHARVEKRSDGLWLIDLKSANGIRIGSSKVPELKLENGITFRLGRTEVRVVAAGGDLIGLLSPEIVVEDSGVFERDAPDLAQAKKLQPIEEPKSQWWDVLRELAERSIRDGVIPETRKLFPFDDHVAFRFIRGPQAGIEWTVGYGPRLFGASSLDLCFEERGLPAQCFELQPHQDGTLLHVIETARGRVLLNGKKTDRAFLKNGDKIQIGETELEVLIGPSATT